MTQMLPYTNVDEFSVENIPALEFIEQTYDEDRYIGFTANLSYKFPGTGIARPLNIEFPEFFVPVGLRKFVDRDDRSGDTELVFMHCELDSAVPGNQKISTKGLGSEDTTQSGLIDQCIEFVADQVFANLDFIQSNSLPSHGLEDREDVINRIHYPVGYRTVLKYLEFTDSRGRPKRKQVLRRRTDCDPTITFEVEPATVFKNLKGETVDHESLLSKPFRVIPLVTFERVFFGPMGIDIHMALASGIITQQWTDEEAFPQYATLQRLRLGEMNAAIDDETKVDSLEHCTDSTAVCLD
jgi:hypothetical protein